MNQSWLDQLLSPVSNTGTAPQEPASLPEQAIQCIERSDLTVVRFSGQDAAGFLQSQMCNDHSAVNASTAQLDGYCSPKGRLLALPTVAADASGEDYFWLLSKDLVEPVLKRLSMFVLRSDVSIDVQSHWVVAGLAAKTDLLDTALEPWFGKPMAQAMSSWTFGEVTLIKAHSGTGYSRVLMFGPSESVKTSLMACLEEHSENMSEPLFSSQTSWTLGDIHAGVPTIVAKTQDAFVPQMVNLEQLNGLSFTKGCYPGQEIVARMQYLGKLKRTMVRFSTAYALSLIHI